MQSCRGPKIVLTTEQADRAAGKEGDYELEERYGCGLNGGHPGEHMSCVQSYEPGGFELWARWSDPAEVELVEVEMCESDPDEEGSAACVLPTGHWGVHTDGGDLDWDAGYTE